MNGLSQRFFSNPTRVFLAAVVLRCVLLCYGHCHDQHSALKYTDIDYFVFTDASRYVAWGQSPYLRDTYRYTPLLAWLLVPTSWGGWWFDFGKALFAGSDIVAGWLIYAILRQQRHMSVERALKFASIWLLNPMVAQISTRGSSEGLLAAAVMALLWAVLQRKYLLTGLLLGFTVHFKIYPFIYGPSILWWMTKSATSEKVDRGIAPYSYLLSFVKDISTPDHLMVIISSGSTFICLNAAMFYIYGAPFLEHTYLYHLVRSDHRHNFSPYNLLLYLNASPFSQSKMHPESLAFLPQLFLSALAMPLVLSRRDLPSCMLAQTFAFVTFNKVCTSQYFLWYMVFLPFYLPNSTLLKNRRVGISALLLWVIGQLVWLQQGYQLELLGRSTFVPGLWLATLSFFLVNCWILGVVVSDIVQVAPSSSTDGKKKSS